MKTIGKVLRKLVEVPEIAGFIRALKITGKVLHKLVELTPVFAVVIVFIISTIILPPACKYTYLRHQISKVENKAEKEGHYIAGNIFKEDWGDGRKENHESLNAQLDELVCTSKVAKYCSDNGTPGYTPKRDIPLLIMGVMWILSILWIVTSIIAEIRHKMRTYNKRKQVVEEKLKKSIEERKQKAKVERSLDSIRVSAIKEELFVKDRSTNN